MIEATARDEALDGVAFVSSYRPAFGSVKEDKLHHNLIIDLSDEALEDGV